MPSLRTPDGRVLSWEERGSGPPLLVHPGGPGMSSSYFGELPELSAERTLLLIDPRGTGESERPSDPAAYGLEDYAADIEAIREQLEMERIDLLGHSHGGFVAINWAGNHPDRVGMLVLANTTPRFTDEIRARREQRIESHRGRPYFEQALAALEARRAERYSNEEELSELLVDDWRLQIDPGVDYEPIRAAVQRAGANGDALHHFNTRIATGMDQRSMLERIGSPTLVLASELDPFSVSAEETADALPDSALVMLPGADHFAFLEAENGPAWSRAVLDFLARD
jgi:pimeloyl-ACP methyl ester carboxylesterase